MRFVDVESSSIFKLGYDAETATLVVVFHKDKQPTRAYAFKDVAAPDAEGFIAAESKGKYFAAQIRPVYKCVRLPLYLLRLDLQPVFDPTILSDREMARRYRQRLCDLLEAVEANYRESSRETYEALHTEGLKVRSQLDAEERFAWKGEV